MKEKNNLFLNFLKNLQKKKKYPVYILKIGYIM